MAKRAPVIVVTGGTGSGKSTVAAVFRKQGARIVDVDRLARRLLRPGNPGWHEILMEFCSCRLAGKLEPGRVLTPADFEDKRGQALAELPWVVDETGAIQRGKLGAIVFSRPEALEALNKIMHPKLRKLLDAKIKLHRKLSGRPLVLDMAVYPEKAFRGLADAVLWVRAPGGMRAQRLARPEKGAGRLNLEEASARVRIQWKDEEFEKLADFILANLGSDTDLRQGAEEVWPKILNKASGDS
jgi:dephospho-CoA kinase